MNFTTVIHFSINYHWYWELPFRTAGEIDWIDHWYNSIYSITLQQYPISLWCLAFVGNDEDFCSFFFSPNISTLPRRYVRVLGGDRERQWERNNFFIAIYRREGHAHRHSDTETQRKNLQVRYKRNYRWITSGITDAAGLYIRICIVYVCGWALDTMYSGAKLSLIENRVGIG